MTSVESIAALLTRLRARGETLAVAESLTGGQLAAAITAVPGASAVFRGGVVAYASDVKVSVLDVQADLVAAHGVVSAECAAAMASGAGRLLGSTWAVATTGVAGPDPQESKPPGLAYVAVAGPGGVEAHECRLTGTRSEIQAAVVHEAVALLLRRADVVHPGEPEVE